MAPRSNPAAAVVEDDDPVLRALENAPIGPALTEEERAALAELGEHPRFVRRTEAEMLATLERSDDGG
jgi:hypothetical protein